MRGKPLNVRGASASQISNNEEVKALMTILGLDISKEKAGGYTANDVLPYRHLMILSDQGAPALASPSSPHDASGFHPFAPLRFLFL